MEQQLILLAVAAGCIWHGAQIIWVAPPPSQFSKDKPQVEKGSAQAFQLFWLDQYAWIGITLAAFGAVLGVWGFVS